MSNPFLVFRSIRATFPRWPDTNASCWNAPTAKSNFPRFPIVAEDLGLITPDVREVMARFKMPGMKVLQFAFDEDDPRHPFLTHTHEEHSIVYTGTHDNNTIQGWFQGEASPEVRQRVYRYLGGKVPEKAIHWALIRLALMSVARLAILTLQDLLGLKSDARMNLPSANRGNWRWRMSPGQITAHVTRRLREATLTYGRGKK